MHRPSCMHGPNSMNSMTINTPQSSNSEHCLPEYLNRSSEQVDRKRQRNLITNVDMIKNRNLTPKVGMNEHRNFTPGTGIKVAHQE